MKGAKSSPLGKDKSEVEEMVEVDIQGEVGLVWFSDVGDSVEDIPFGHRSPKT